MTARLLIAGGPRVGKTSLALDLAAKHGLPNIRETDALIGRLAWSDASAEVARWLREPGPWLIEGVAVARAIRKWLREHPTGTPADVLYVRHVPRIALTTHQQTMRQGCMKVWNDIRDELSRRGLNATEF